MHQWEEGRVWGFGGRYFGDKYSLVVLSIRNASHDKARHAIQVSAGLALT